MFHNAEREKEYRKKKKDESESKSVLEIYEESS